LSKYRIGEILQLIVDKITRMLTSVKNDLIGYAKEIGLDLIGIAAPDPFDRFLGELASREHHYRERYAYRIKRWQEMAEPRRIMPDAKSLVVMGFYYKTEDTMVPPHSGRMARIVAYGHLGIIQRARLMRSFLKKWGYKAVIGAHRKEAAVRAGLGSIGKNNLVINSRYGSWVAYQTIITNAEMEPDKAAEEDICGDCSICLKACPSHALYEPRRLDPRRCVSYMLTSHEIPEERFPALNNYILGCDRCQEVCPKNAHLEPKASVENLLPDDVGLFPPLTRLLDMTEDEFQESIMAPISEKMAGGKGFTILSKNKVLRKLVQWLMTTFLKGREILPETFVHASGNLNIYKRNAIVAAGNMGDIALLDYVRAFKSDRYLGPYADWAERRITNAGR